MQVYQYDSGRTCSLCPQNPLRLHNRVRGEEWLASDARHDALPHVRRGVADALGSLKWGNREERGEKGYD